MRLTAFALLLTATPAPAGEPAPSPRLVAAVRPTGVYEGVLDVGAVKLRLGFTFTAPPVGPVAAALLSPDQTPDPIPFDAVTADGRGLTLRLKAVGAAFTGIFSPDLATLTGEWKQSGAPFPLSLNKVEAMSVRRRPQTPQAPFPYGSAEVTFDNPVARVTLAGTMTTPRGAKAAPAVVLVSGSGPQDRDETLFGHKPFWVLADHLTRRGVVVLRYDDRGVGKSTGSQAGATSADFAADATAAVAFLAKQPGVDPKRVGIVGHSEGGLIGPLVAADRPAAVGFLVLLAGPGVPGGQILAAQTDDLLAAAGGSAEVRKLAAGLVAALLKAVPSAATRAEAKKALGTAADAYVATLTPAQVKQIGWDAAGTRDLALSVWSDPWQQYFLRSDPRPTLARVRCPVLALNGEKDLQVRAADNLAAIKAANPAAVTRAFPGVNHLFQRCKTGAVSEYGAIEETLAPEVLAAVGDWILALKPTESAP